MSLSANITTQSSHGGSHIGSYVSGASTDISYGGQPAVIIGTIYHCPNPAHPGNYPVVSGSGSVNTDNTPAINEDSTLSCGATLDINNYAALTIGG